MPGAARVPTHPLPRAIRARNRLSCLSAGRGGRNKGKLRFRLFTVIFAAALVALIGRPFEARADGVDLKVDVSGLRNYKGRLVLFLWPDSDEIAKYPDPSKVQIRDERPGDLPCDLPKTPVCRKTVDSLQNLTVSYIFKSVPPGDYAVFVFHDENNNGVLDTGFLNRPLEARGYSQVLPDDVNPIASTIKFQQARFTLGEPKTIVIGLRYPPRW
jgi:uncharacterized protein (DUF2141 family)